MKKQTVIFWLIVSAWIALYVAWTLYDISKEEAFINFYIAGMVILMLIAYLTKPFKIFGKK